MSSASGRPFFYGKPSNRQGKRMGTSHECFSIRKSDNYLIHNSDLISIIKGIGPQFSERLEKKENIKTIKNLLDRVRKPNENAHSRREFLKKIFQNFTNRKVNRMAFANVRHFLISKGIDVLDMTVFNKVII